MHRMYVVSRATAAATLAFGLLVASNGAYADTSDVEATAARAAATLERLHHNASKALVTAAQDKAFGAYFHAHDHDSRKESKARIDRVSLSVQERFHVEEMCLIDPSGAEISRIVGKEIAHDLATDEADAPFFAPGFETEHRKVYISPIYLSPDADRWVIAYVTPVLVDGNKKSILHYEHSLTAYHTALARQAETLGGNIIVVTDTGHVIFDSRTEIETDRVSGKEDRGDYFQNFILAGLDLAELKAAVNADGAEAVGRVAGSDQMYDVALRQVGRWSIIVWKTL